MVGSHVMTWKLKKHTPEKEMLRKILFLSFSFVVVGLSMFLSEQTIIVNTPLSISEYCLLSFEVVVDVHAI